MSSLRFWFAYATGAFLTRLTLHAKDGPPNWLVTLSVGVLFVTLGVTLWFKTRSR